MTSLRTLALACVALVMAACNTTSRSVSLNEVRGYKITAIDVRFKDDAFINWGNGSVAVMNARGLDTTNPASAEVLNTPEGRAQLRNLAADRLRGIMQASLAGAVNGARPVIIRATMSRIDLPSVAQRVIIGGHPGMSGDVQVVDAASGRVLTEAPSFGVVSVAGQGIGGSLVDALVSGGEDHFDRTGRNFSNQFRNWLLAEG